MAGTMNRQMTANYRFVSLFYCYCRVRRWRTVISGRLIGTEFLVQSVDNSSLPLSLRTCEQEKTVFWQNNRWAMKRKSKSACNLCQTIVQFFLLFCFTANFRFLPVHYARIENKGYPCDFIYPINCEKIFKLPLENFISSYNMHWKSPPYYYFPDQLHWLIPHQIKCPLPFNACFVAHLVKYSVRSQSESEKVCLLRGSARKNRLQFAQEFG